MTDPPQRPADVPEQIASYRVGRKLGAGGMGAVYEATDTRNGSRVALKLLNVELASDDSYRARFTREAHIAALLHSPYTVQQIESGFDQGRYYIVMRLIEGETLTELLRRETPDEGRALLIAAQVARALEEAEARGVVHRDIKPSNIMFDRDGTALVLDFGVARQAGAATMTVAGGFVGTLSYAAPEAADGKNDHRSDIYSLGVTLYHMLTGGPPFTGDTLELLRHHQLTPVPLEPLKGHRPEVVAVVERCLAKSPGDRHQSASELAGVLEHLAAELGVAVSQPVHRLLTASLSSAVVRRRPLGFGASATYDLRLQNSGDENIRVRLTASDAGTAGDRLRFALVETVELAPQARAIVRVRVAARHRWGRAAASYPFTIGVSDGLGGPQTSIAGALGAQPVSVTAIVSGGAAVALIGVVAVVAALSLGGGSGDEEPSGDGEPGTGGPLEEIGPDRIVFSSDRAGGDHDLYLMSADGEVILALTDNAFEDHAPVFSPDGERIAFERRAATGKSIAVINADGSGEIVLTGSGVVGAAPSWSPDGTRIVFECTGTFGLQAAICVMDADGSAREAIFLDETAQAARTPSWSPDGELIAFSLARGNDSDIYVVDLRGENGVQLTDDPAFDNEPAWSRDGEQIAFTSTRGGSAGIYLMDADGARQRLVTPQGVQAVQPSWSFDGRLVFMSIADGSPDLFVLRLDGSAPVRLTTDRSDDWNPDWWTAPSGRPQVTVTFSQPIDGATVTNPFVVSMHVQGLEVAPAGELLPGTGHHHIVISTDSPQAGLPIPSDDKHLHFGNGQTTTFLSLPNGEHRLTLVFADGLHVPYERQLNQTVTITVE